jgi:serine/threonine-protein kinase GIN4
VSTPAPPLRLSAVVDRSLFVATPTADKGMMETDDLEPSPHFVEPYPCRIITGSRSLDSPNAKRRVESSYEQLITSTSGVKKVGLGYQSDNKGALVHMASPGTAPKRNHVRFTSTRRAMPPAISSEDWRKTVSVDELGIVVTPSTPDRGADSSRNDRSGTVSVVRRAFKLMAGKTISKRSSRIS